VSLTLGFAVLYFWFSYHDGQGPTLIEDMPSASQRLFNSIYYSIITATSTGYGDITPQGLSKFLAAAQSIMALFLFAAFFPKLISYRQTISLHEVHKLTFEESFHNIREELFITRKDFDLAIENAKNSHIFAEEDWEDLTTAYRRLQSLLLQIPGFYGTDDIHYTIDARREGLLLGAVHRTLHRIDTVLDVLSTENIPWESHSESYVELHELVKIMDSTTPLWKSRSPHNDISSFKDIVHLNEKVRDHLKTALPNS
jgi:hypothetical protein